MAELIFFIVFAIGAIAGSLGVVLARNPINSAISLVIGFFFVAGTYVLLSASFMGVIQVLVYAGAIMVLFLFVLMLLNLGDEELGDGKIGFHQLVGTAMSVAFVVLLAQTIHATSFAQTRMVAESVPEGFGEVASIGTALITTFVLPFEMAAVLLLTGIVSAVVIAKKRF